jgi:hypothetical protein
VTFHVKHVLIHRINHVQVVISMEHIDIIILQCKHVLLHVPLGFMKVIINVYHVINHV